MKNFSTHTAGRLPNVYLRFLSSSNLRARSSKLTSSPPPGLLLATVETLMVGTVGSCGIVSADGPEPGVTTDGRGSHCAPPGCAPGCVPATGPGTAHAALYGGKFGVTVAAACNQHKWFPSPSSYMVSDELLETGPIANAIIMLDHIYCCDCYLPSLLQLRSGERTGRQLLWSTTLLLLTLLPDGQVSISLIIHGLWWTVSRQVQSHVVLTCTNGSRPITFLWLWPATDHEPHCRHMHSDKIWRWTESTPWSRWWCSHRTGIYSDCSNLEIIITQTATMAAWPSSSIIGRVNIVTLHQAQLVLSQMTNAKITGSNFQDSNAVTILLAHCGTKCCN